MVSNVRKKGISMVALVITIIVLIVLTSAVVITGVGAPKQAQLAVFYNNLDTVQELVTLKMSDNMITEALSGYGDNYKWVDIVENYTAEKGRANEPVVFDECQINGVWLERISPTMLQNNTSLAQGERSKYYVSSQGIVYYDGFVYEGQTYYTKNADPVENGQTLTNLLPTNGSFYEAKGVNSPKLLPGMTAVYWDTNGNEVTSANPGADAEFYNNWYDYIEQTSTTENGGTSKWANAKTADGSYWVWIPRYAYSITSGYHGQGLTYNQDNKTTEAGTIDVEFLKGKTNEGTTGRTSWDNASGANNWNIHPAFTVEGIELAGIWVAKYEMSMEKYNEQEELWENIETTNTTIGNVQTSNVIKAVSKPGKHAWRQIEIEKIFFNALNYDMNNLNNNQLESHLMKNSEWGAVAYLAHSKYGRYATEISKNSAGYYTAGGINTNINDSALQSTTGNCYGIYDINGTSLEYTAAGLTSFVMETFGVENSKYYDCYDISASKDDYGYIIQSGIKKRIYGDAVYETSLECFIYVGGIKDGKETGIYIEGAGEASWYGDRSWIVYDHEPFFQRGGRWNNGTLAGAFATTCNLGLPREGNSWRVVLWGSLN